MIEYNKTENDVCYPIKRYAERDALCRACSNTIYKGDEMISWYTPHLKGVYIHLCVNCVEKIHSLVIN